MSKEDRDPILLWHLRSLHDNAIRSYYIVEHLAKILYGQEKGFLEQLSIPLGMAASVVSIFALMQNVAPVTTIFAAYFTAIALLACGPIYEKRHAKRNGLDDATLLAIYFDEVAKYANQLELAGNYDRSNLSVSYFFDDAQNALEGAVRYLREKIAELKMKRKYQRCLADIGRNEAWAEKLDKRIERLLGKGLLS